MSISNVRASHSAEKNPIGSFIKGLASARLVIEGRGLEASGLRSVFQGSYFFDVGIKGTVEVEDASDGILDIFPLFCILNIFVPMLERNRVYINNSRNIKRLVDISDIRCCRQYPADPSAP